MIRPKITVEKPPPMKPSHVFLGLNLISGVLPKKNPNIYAMTSLHTIIETGTIHQMSPVLNIQNKFKIKYLYCSFKIY